MTVQRLRSVVIVAAAALVSLSACDRRPQQSASPTPTTVPATASAVRSTWPFIDQAGGTPEGPTPSSTAPVATADLTRRNYYVLFDASGSMQDTRCAGNSNKLTVAKLALERFASRLPIDANLGLHVFGDGGIRQLIPLGPLDRALLQQQVASIHAGGGTPLAESTAQAYAVLTAQARKQLGYGEYHLVIVTDGEATGEDPRGIVDRIVTESPVLVHTIGFCISETHSLNQPGRTVYKSADNPEALDQTFADVLAEAPSFDVKRFDAAK